MWRKLFMLTGAVALMGAGITLFAQHQHMPPIAKAVYWAHGDAEIYLLEKGSGGLRLTVISQKPLTVTYRTRINSIEPVVKVLTPTSSANGITIYDFEHHFTKMTIWMALEFSIDEKPVPELTRTFYNDIHEVVANGHFDFGPKTKP